MEHDEDGAFFTKVAAAVAMRRDAVQRRDSGGDDRVPSAHPMLARIDVWDLYGDQQGEDSLDVAVRLKYRLDVFHSGSASWGIVDDWRPDGAAYKCHGVVIEFCVNATRASRNADQRARTHRHIREAIDLVQLVIALDPMAIKSTFSDIPEPFKSCRRVDYEDELRAVARGVPWELRLKFDVDVNRPTALSEFTTNFMQQHDDTAADATFVQQRQELLHALIQHEQPTLERIARVTANAMVRAEIVVHSPSESQLSMLASEDFFGQVAAFLADLDRYQTRHKKRKWRHHTPFQVHKAVLKLESIHITPTALRLAKRLMASRMPVEVCQLTLDFRLISCSDNDLCKFVQVLTATATHLSLATGVKRASDQGYTIDPENQNRFTRILKLVQVIAGIESIRRLDIGPLLGMCQWSYNRCAVWRGLFADVLSRDEQLEHLTFRIGLLSTQIVLTAAEGELIEESVGWARQIHPEKLFRVRHLEIHFQSADMGAVRSLLEAFDDVERLTLHCHDRQRQMLSLEAFQVVFQYPSIYSIDLMGVTIQSMDVLNPNIIDERFPNKPVLRELELLRVDVEDTSSFSRFFKQLRPTSGSRRELANTLEYLEIAVPDRASILDQTAVDLLDDALAANATLRHVDVTIPIFYPNAVVVATDFLRKHSGRLIPVSGSGAERISKITKARKLAFLSAISESGDTNGAHCRLDAALVSKILAFGAPHVSRTTSEDRYS